MLIKKSGSLFSRYNLMFSEMPSLLFSLEAVANEFRSSNDLALILLIAVCPPVTSDLAQILFRSCSPLYHDALF